jgi:DNA-binding MarR family transcriptional regulator
MFNWETGDPYLTAWVRMRQASDAAARTVEIQLGKRHTTTAQVDILLVLSMSKVPLSPGQIAAYVFREKHSVSALLSRMRRAGYIKKARSKQDQRVVKVELQPKGRDLLDQTAPVIMGYARDVLSSRFSEKEIRQFDRYLKAMRDRSLRELGTEPRRLPPTMEWQSDLLAYWQGLLRAYRETTISGDARQSGKPEGALIKQRGRVR